MPAKKKTFDFEAVLMAAGVGAAAQPLQDVLQDKVFTNKPQLVPLAMAGLGLSLSYFGGDKLKPASLALIAVGAADFTGDLMSETRARRMVGESQEIDWMNGLSRIETACRATTISRLFAY